MRHAAAPRPTPASPNLDRLRAWSEGLGMVGMTEPLEPLQRRLGLRLYRTLAEGEPVSMACLAEAEGIPVAEVAAALCGRPGIVLDDVGDVTAYHGLTLNEMPHALELDGRRLYTWCAWDTMLVVPVLGRLAEAVSTWSSRAGRCGSASLRTVHMTSAAPACV